MSNWSKPYNDITWRNGNAPYLNAENLNENQSWIKELDSRTKELYARTDTAEPGGIARDVYYDNGTSGLDANNVQDAIDKIGTNVVVLTSADDLDNITDVTKTYAVTYGDYPLNSPVTNASFRVEVKYDGRSNEANRRQIVYLKAQNVRYERTYNNSVWSAWVKDVPNELQHKVVTGTTDANGLISLGVEKSRVYAAFIASNTGTDGKYVITPAASSNSYVRIVSAVSGANVANYGITINVLYI